MTEVVASDPLSNHGVVVNRSEQRIRCSSSSSPVRLSPPPSPRESSPRLRQRHRLRYQKLKPVTLRRSTTTSFSWFYSHRIWHCSSSIPRFVTSSSFFIFEFLPHSILKPKFRTCTWESQATKWIATILRVLSSPNWYPYMH